MANSIQELIKSLGDSYAPAIARARARGRARARKIRDKKFISRWTWQVEDGFPVKLLKGDNEMSDKIFLGVSDFDDLISSEVLRLRNEKGLSTVQRETTVLCNRETWKSWAEKFFKDCLYTQASSSSGFVIHVETNQLIKFDVNSNSTTVRCFGSQSWADKVIESIESNFSVVTSYIEWIYAGDGSSVNVPLNRDRLPIEEMYPFLNGESLNSFYDRYMNSSANILLLIGPPGTGKTTFIRGLLAHRNCSAIVTYDAGILEKDAFFARFIEDDAEIMVLEDSDTFLKSRSDGNTMMHRFLNVGDGLVTTKGKKMIFSTNLPSVRDIDSALIRPGRCFDILEFKPLSLQHANALAKKLETTIPNKKAGEIVEYSIAEVFNHQSEQTHTAKTNRKVGFL
jgi:hypothetical protein